MDEKDEVKAFTIQLSIRCEEDINLKEKLKESAKRNDRSLNMQVLHFLKEGLLFDEKFHSLSEDEKLVILQTVRELTEKFSTN